MNRLLLAFICFFLTFGGFSAEAGQWRLAGSGTFVAQDHWTEGDGWVGRVEDRSQDHIVVSQSFRGGQVAKTARLDWTGLPQTLQPSELPPLQGRGAIVQMVNPSGWAIQTQIYCFIKTPYQPFWEGTLPMQQGGALELRNTGLRIPEGLAGSKMTIVYRLLGFGPAKDAEFTYEWIGGPSVVGTRSDGGQVPALEGTWAYKGTVNTISRGSGEPLVFTNYGGSSSRGRFIDASSVVAIDWEGGLRGSLHDGGNTIRWANGTVWFRPRSEGR